MRNKRVLNMIKKLLSENKVMSTQQIHEQMVGKRYCPSRNHLGTILASLPWVEVHGDYNIKETGSKRNLWRMRDEAPTDN
jgi:hypothetical protein